MQKAYILNMKYGITQWRVWFAGEDDLSTQKQWELAREQLEIVGDECQNSQEFFKRAIQLFESFGFVHIKG